MAKYITDDTEIFCDELMKRILMKKLLMKKYLMKELKG